MERLAGGINGEMDPGKEQDDIKNKSRTEMGTKRHDSRRNTVVSSLEYIATGNF